MFDFYFVAGIVLAFGIGVATAVGVCESRIRQANATLRDFEQDMASRFTELRDLHSRNTDLRAQLRHVSQLNTKLADLIGCEPQASAALRQISFENHLKVYGLDVPVKSPATPVESEASVTPIHRD